MALIRGRYLGQHEGVADLWINPAKVTYFCGSQKPYNHIFKDSPTIFRRFMNIFEKKSFGGDWDKNAINIEKHGTYIVLEDYIKFDGDYVHTRFYQNLCKKLHTKGFAKHKNVIMKNEKDMAEFFEKYLNPMLFSMRASGYVVRPGDDLGGAAIDREGRIHKATAGCHRFIMARLLGVPSVPVRITFVHDEWLEARKLTVKDLDQQKGIAEIRKIAEQYA